MADGIIQLSPDSTGKKVDTEELVVGANTVHRERMQIAGDSATDIAPVTAADGLLVNLGTNNDVTIAGGSTLAEQQAQTALLTTIDGDTGTLAGAVAGTEVQVDVVAALPAGNNNIGDVDIASLPNEGQQNMAGSISVAIASDQSAVPVSGTVVVTGSATLAEQQTQTTHLAAIETAVEILDNAIAGTEMQVDIVAALPAGTNNIGDVDVLSSALPTGAATSANQTTEITHLATIAGDTTAIETAVQIMDDWDEADRAKVNPIVGQAGVAAGAGAVAATVQRVTLASDDPAVTALQILDNAISGSEMQVDVVAALPAGTNNIGDVDVLTMPVVEVVGDVAADAAVPTNPVIIGGRASTAQPTAVSADGDSVNMWTTRRGAPVVTAAPHIGIFNGEPWTLTGETAQYTTTQTSAVLVAGGASERLVVTKVQIQVGGTTAGTLQLYFGTGAYSRGTNLAIFDGEFAPSATLKPGVIMDGPFISAANGDDLLVTTSAAINPLTITVWYYVVV